MNMTFITSTPPTFKMSKVAATNLRDNPKLFVDYVLMFFFMEKAAIIDDHQVVLYFRIIIWKKHIYFKKWSVLPTLGPVTHSPIDLYVAQSSSSISSSQVYRPASLTYESEIG